MSEALLWTQRIASVSVMLQALEFFKMRHSLKSSRGGIWDWRIIRQEFAVYPRIIQSILDFFLGYPGFIFLLCIQLIAAVSILISPHPVAFCALFAGSVLICLRWRGTFNGGSDFMTLIVLMALCVSSFFPENPKVQIGCLGYIALQSCVSYFLAGWVKIRKKNWRTGKALRGFLASSIYEPNWTTRWIIQQPVVAFLLSWGVLVFECSFPLALFFPDLCLIWIGTGLTFHLGNAYILGLNRFVWAWAATYPALFYFSSQYLAMLVQH